MRSDPVTADHNRMVRNQAKARSVYHASEHQEQVALFQWADIAVRTYPELVLLHAIPNGGDRNRVVGAKLKAEGVKRGVPDLCLPVSRGGYHGLYIELKSVTGTVRAEQQWWLATLRDEGYEARLVVGWEAAKTLIVDYLESGP